MTEHDEDDAHTEPKGGETPPTEAGDAEASEPTQADADQPDANDPEPKQADPEPPQAEAEAEAEPAPAPAAPARLEPGEVLIEAQGLSKYYGSFTAIEGVSFEVRRGEVVAFLGPNGAGKSTTMKCLTGLMAPNTGEARICGKPVLEARLEVAAKLGFLPENGPLYQEMTPFGLLRYLGEARGLSGDALEGRIAQLERTLSLGTVMHKPIEKLSKGYRQRVGLAQAMLHEPDVLILDEPTTGLDPNQIRDVRRTIQELGQTKAVLLSTHILQEVEAVADRVVFIHDGRVVFSGTVEALKERSASLDDAFAELTHAGGAQ